MHVKLVRSLAMVLGLVLSLLFVQSALAAGAGWDTTWVREPAASGPLQTWQHLSADAGRVVYQTGDGTVVLYDAVTEVASTLTPREEWASITMIEGDYVTWSINNGSTEAGEEGLYVYSVSRQENRKVAGGQVFGDPILRAGRILWRGGTNESVVLNLYDIASGSNTALNEGTWGWGQAILRDEWVLWHERQEDGSNLLFAYDIAAGEKHVYPGVSAVPRMLIGDQVVLSASALPGGSGMGGLALFDFRSQTLTGISVSAGSSISSVAADEQTQRLAWTAVDDAGEAYVGIYDVADGSFERVPMPRHLLGPIEMAGDVVLFRAKAQQGLLTYAPMALFAYDITDHTLTELGQLLKGFPFATDGTRAYWITTVLDQRGALRLPSRWLQE